MIDSLIGFVCHVKIKCRLQIRNHPATEIHIGYRWSKF